jgi:hypothetical protein
MNKIYNACMIEIAIAACLYWSPRLDYSQCRPWYDWLLELLSAANDDRAHQ